MTAALHIAAPTPERVYGSPGFIKLTRNPAMPRPARFEPTRKASGDVVI